MRVQLLTLALTLIAAPVLAQPVAIDHLTPAWSAEHQHTAEVLSNVTLWTTVGLDTLASWQAEDRRDAFLKQGIRTGVVMGAGLAVKVLVHRRRPCALTCGIDNPDHSFWSSHTAFAFSSANKRLAISIPLASSTGYFRIAANRHYLSDVLAGSAVGLVAGRLIR